jgi:hypothetical protein
MAFCKLQCVAVRTKCLCTGGLKGVCACGTDGQQKWLCGKTAQQQQLGFAEAALVFQGQLAMLTVFTSAVML